MTHLTSSASPFSPHQPGTCAIAPCLPILDAATANRAIRRLAQRCGSTWGAADRAEMHRLYQVWRAALNQDATT